MKTALYGFINSIVSRIENGFDDVATLTLDIDGIPFQMKNWIQISGPLFYGGAPHDDIYVTICLDGYNSDELEVYQKYKYHKEKGDEGMTKHYKWTEKDKIANEIEEIVVALLGEYKANAFVSDEVFIKLANRQISVSKSNNRKSVKSQLKIYLLSVVFAVILLLVLALLMGEF